MDGRLAVLFGLMSLMGDGFEGEGWNVERADVGGMLTTSYGQVQFGGDKRWGEEIRFTSVLPKWRKFNPVIDFSITDKGGAWLGFGLYQQFDINVGGLPAFAGFSFAPGLYMPGDDVDLGLPIEFRSGIEFGVRFAEDWQVSLSYDHRSNGDISRVNPGIETLQLRISKAFN